jgi:hypothetical protein
MYVLFITFLFVIPSSDSAIVPITRSEIQHYTTESLCKADTAKQLKLMLAEVPDKPDLIISKCVKVTGPAGTDT